ncbi:MAG: hypothetical protein WA708_03890 [Acidobacteriaceae bacterium]
MTLPDDPARPAAIAPTHDYRSIYAFALESTGAPWSSCTHEEAIPYLEHPELPRNFTEDTVLWRYLTFAKFVALLEHQALHFTRVDRLPDSSIGITNRSGLNDAPGAATTDTIRLSPEVRRALGLMRISSHAVFASCWYAGCSELSAPWERYGGRNSGVAVRSSIGALKAALNRSTQRIHIANVLYFDYETTAIPLGNAYLSALHKHASFMQEREVRALLLQVGDKSKVFSPGPEQGIDVDVDIGKLIEEVRMAPKSDPWFYSLVAAVSQRYGATWPVLPANTPELYPPE